ncbi:hypothetical protein ACOSQ4_027060 [Xanthoceras sorbifolium]
MDSSDKTVESSKAKVIASSKPSSPVSEQALVFIPESLSKRRRLVGRLNDFRTISQGKRITASPKCRNTRQVKMCRKLERTPDLVLPVSFVPPPSEDILEPSLADVSELRVPFLVKVDSDESNEDRLVQSKVRLGTNFVAERYEPPLSIGNAFIIDPFVLAVDASGCS